MYDLQSAAHYLMLSVCMRAVYGSFHLDRFHVIKFLPFRCQAHASLGK